MSSDHLAAPRAGVIGAGIAGLASAIALRRVGWDVEVFEKSRMKHEVGAAIIIMPFAVSILDEWGFNFEKGQGVPFRRMTVSHAGSLQQLFHDEFPDLKEAYGYDALSFHRADLHQELFRLAVEQESSGKGRPVTVRLDAEVASVDCESGVIGLSTNEKIQKDLLVIADGAHTHCLDALVGQPVTTSKIGRSIYRILLDRSVVDGNAALTRFLTGTPNATTGMCCALDTVDNVFMTTYPCRNGASLNVAVVHDTKKSPTNNPDADKSWQAPSSIAEVLTTTHNFHPDLQEIFKLAKDEDIKIHHGMHRSPLNNFTRGKAVAVGDTAHLQLPTHAAGGAIAIESAGVLEILMRDIATNQSSFPPTPTPASPTTPSGASLSPADVASPARPPCSTSSSTQNLIVGAKKQLDTHSPSNLSAVPPKVVVTGDATTTTAPPPDLANASTQTEDTPPQLSPTDALRTSLISRSLTLFDSLRVPRCTAFQILANGGFMSQGKPEIVEQIRRHGFDGPLPGPSAGPWSKEFRDWYFNYDARAAAEKALAELSPR